MSTLALVWALPDWWTQFELLAPDVDAKIAAEMQRRFETADVDEQELERIIGIQINRIQALAEDGVILLATSARAGSDADVPPAGLSLTLAVANRPAPESPVAPEGDVPPSRESPQLHSTAPVISFEMAPFMLDDPELMAFTLESRAEVPVPGAIKPFPRFQAQAFVVPKAHAGMAVITVTTFKAELEDEARETARNLANTLCFVTVDEETDQP